MNFIFIKFLILSSWLYYTGNRGLFYSRTGKVKIPFSIQNFKRKYVLQNTVDEWSSIFLIGALAYIIPAILFIIFGSGNIQHWNDLQKTENLKSGEPSTVSKN